MILLIILIFIFVVIPVQTFIIKHAVKEALLEAYDIIQNEKEPPAFLTNFNLMKNYL